MMKTVEITSGSSLIVCSQQDLEQAVENVLLKHITEKESDHSKEKISRVAAAKRLGKDLSTLNRWVHAGKLHPIYVGASVFFPLPEIEAIEEGRR